MPTAALRLCASALIPTPSTAPLCPTRHMPQWIHVGRVAGPGEHPVMVEMHPQPTGDPPGVHLGRMGKEACWFSARPAGWASSALFINILHGRTRPACLAEPHQNAICSEVPAAACRLQGHPPPVRQLGGQRGVRAQPIVHVEQLRTVLSAVSMRGQPRALQPNRRCRCCSATHAPHHTVA